MCKFEGSGAFTLAGADARIYDARFETTGLLTLTAGQMANCAVTGSLEVNSNARVSDSVIEDLIVDGNDVVVNKCSGDSVVVTGDDNYLDVHLSAASGTAVSIVGSQNQVVGVIATASEHGVQIEGSRNTIKMKISECGGGADNTYDCINITGASNRNQIEGCQFIPRLTGNQTRSAVNVGGTGECNMVVGNDLGDPNDYGTDALIDTANNTQFFWPADATYGDNFTDCGSGS